MLFKVERTDGTMLSFAQADPNCFVSFCRVSMAASRIEYTLSSSHPMHCGTSCFFKNSGPSCCARRGTWEMMARRTLQCSSLANSSMAGMRLLERRSTPITFPTLSNLAMIPSRASECSSFKSSKNTGRSSLEVTSLPTSGESSVTTLAKEILTYWLESLAKSWQHGMMDAVTSSFGTNLANLETQEAATALTSASESCKRDKKLVKRRDKTTLFLADSATSGNCIAAW